MSPGPLGRGAHLAGFGVREHQRWHRAHSDDLPTGQLHGAEWQARTAPQTLASIQVASVSEKKGSA